MTMMTWKTIDFTVTWKTQFLWHLWKIPIWWLWQWRHMQVSHRWFRMYSTSSMFLAEWTLTSFSLVGPTRGKPNFKKSKLLILLLSANIKLVYPSRGTTSNKKEYLTNQDDIDELAQEYEELPLEKIVNQLTGTRLNDPLNERSGYSIHQILAIRLYCQSWEYFIYS